MCVNRRDPCKVLTGRLRGLAEYIRDLLEMNVHLSLHGGASLAPFFSSSFLLLSFTDTSLSELHNLLTYCCVISVGYQFIL